MTEKAAGFSRSEVRTARFSLTRRPVRRTTVRPAERTELTSTAGPAGTAQTAPCTGGIMTSSRRLLLLLLGLLGTAVVVTSQEELSGSRSVLQRGSGRPHRGRLLRRPTVIRIRRLKKQRLEEPDLLAAPEEPPVKEFKCPRLDGVFVDLSQCNKYFECRNDVVTEYTCPRGPLCHTERVYPCLHPVGNTCGSNLARRDPQPEASRLEKLQLEDPQPKGPQQGEEGSQPEETKPVALRLEKLQLKDPQPEGPQPDERKPVAPRLEKLQVKDLQSEDPQVEEREAPQPDETKPEATQLEKLQLKNPQPESPQQEEKNQKPQETKPEAPRLVTLYLKDSEPEDPQGEEKEDTQPEKTRPEHRHRSGRICEKRLSAFNEPGDPDCGAYMRCLNHIAYPSRCPEGLAFDSSRKVCVYADEVETCDSTAYLGYRCAQRRFSPDEVDHFTLEPHPTNCTKFFVCVNKKDGFVAARPQTCLNGTVFETSSNGCKDPREVSVARCGGPSDTKTPKSTQQVTDSAGEPAEGLALKLPAPSPPTPEQLREIEKKKRRAARLVELRFKLQG